MITVWYDADFHDLRVEGKISRSEFSDIMNNATKQEWHSIKLLEDLANRSKRMSDMLMCVSEIVKVGEDIAKRNENDST